MMAFEIRNIVNGSMIRQNIGKNVSIIIKVEDCSGLLVKGKTTDGCSMRINITEPLLIRPGEWIEVIGKPAGPDIIRAKEIISFDQESKEDFDFESYNVLARLLQKCDDINILD